MEIQKYCVFLPFTLFSVARHCSKNDLCSDSLNLFLLAHFSLKVLSILRFFQFASSLWVEFCPGQSGFLKICLFCLFVCIFFYNFIFFNAYRNTEVRKIKQKYVCISVGNWIFFYFLTHTL